MIRTITIFIRVFDVEVNLFDHCFVCGVEKTGTFRERRIGDVFGGEFRSR